MIHAVRWGGLLAWVAFMAVLTSVSTGRVNPSPRVHFEKTSAKEGIEALDVPPLVPGLSPYEIKNLAASARRVEPAMVYVGHPKGDSGTAFVISRKHRLLATNAHVAEIFEEAGGLYAVRNGSRELYPIDKIWYHPDYAHVRREGVSVRTSGGWVSNPSRVISPDVAVLRVAAGGPEFETECVLAPVGSSSSLDLLPVGVFGFSGPYPEADQPMVAVFKTGRVSLLTDFAPAPDRASRWQMVDITAPCGEGDSGGPIFSSDGRVIAIFAWSQHSDDREGKPPVERFVGIRINALWELLNHYGLKGLAAGGS